MKKENLQDYLYKRVRGLRTQADSILETIRRFNEQGFDWDNVTDDEWDDILKMHRLEKRDWQK